MKLTASFPMYDFPEVRDALGVVWRNVARRLERAGVKDVPAALQHDRSVHDLWNQPTLLLSQCCGYDIVKRYVGELIPLATPRWTAPGCLGSEYASVVLVAEDAQATELEHLRDSICVVNGRESHSGTNSLRALVAPLSRDGRFFGKVLISGAHVSSLALLASGRADVTVVDCVTYALLERYRPSTVAGIRPLCYTQLAPGVPFVIRAGVEDELAAVLQRALLEAFEEPDVQAACKDLFIDGIEVVPASAYERIAELERFAGMHGYPELR